MLELIFLILVVTFIIIVLTTPKYGVWWFPATYSADRYAPYIKKVYLNGKDITNMDVVCVSIWPVPRIKPTIGVGLVTHFVRGINGNLKTRGSSVGSSMVMTKNRFGIIRLEWSK